jgi:hypothetical protein
MKAPTFYQPNGANICVWRGSEGKFLLSAGNHPASFIFSMPHEHAVALAYSILEQAQATEKEPAT